MLIFAIFVGIVVHELIHGLCNQYRIAALMPMILLGIIPISIGFIIQSYTVLSFGCVMVVAATGDLTVFWMLRKISSNVLIIDHPDKIGFSIQETSSETNITTV